MLTASEIAETHIPMFATSTLRIAAIRSCVMLKNRYDLIKKYCENENIAVEKKQFIRLKLSNIFSCVRNARNAKSLSIFVSECKEIRKENNSYFLEEYCLLTGILGDGLSLTSLIKGFSLINIGRF